MVPANFSNLARLSDLRLHGNALTGVYEAMSELPGLTTEGLPADLFADRGRSVPISEPVYIQLSLPPGVDPGQSGVTVDMDTAVPDEVHIPPRHRIAGGAVRVVGDSAVDIVLDLRGADGQALDPPPSVPAVICLSVPSDEAGEDTAVLKSDDGDVWSVLDPADPPAGFDPGSGNVAVCGTTDSFSQFVAAEVEVGAGVRALISRIEPSIRGVRVSQGDTIRLSFDIYGRQEILDNKLGEDHDVRVGRRGCRRQVRSDPRTVPTPIIYIGSFVARKIHGDRGVRPTLACLIRR